MFLIKPQPATHGVTEGYIRALAARYRFLQVMPIGSSVLGREISAIRLCCPDVTQKEPEKVLFCAAFHGQEWITSLILLRFCEEICFCLQKNLRMAEIDLHRGLQGRTLFFVPLINPDGVEIALSGSRAAGRYETLVWQLGGDIPGRWQANARGVDINHNFDAGFSTPCPGMPDAPAPRRYRGVSPESEPETAALCALCRKHRFRHVTALHTQGEEIYWDYGEHTPPQSRMMAEILASTSGYTVSSPEGAASFGGFKDWFIDTFHRPGFTFELGRGENPLPLSDMLKIGNQVREMLLLDAIM